MTARVSCIQFLSAKVHFRMSAQFLKQNFTLIWKWSPSVPWTLTFKSWIQHILAVILTPTWRTGLKVATYYRRYVMLKFGQKCSPQKSKFYVRSYGSFCMVHIYMKVLQSIRLYYEDQENIYVLWSDTLSWRVSTFWNSLFFVNRDSRVFLPYSLYFVTPKSQNYCPLPHLPIP